jgi:hypothetical protein
MEEVKTKKHNNVVDVTHKLCSKCKKDKVAEEFSVDPNGPHGLRSQCKECVTGTCLDRIKKNKDRTITVLIKKCKGCLIIKDKGEFYLYPLSKDGLKKELLSKQEDTCQICKRPFSDTKECHLDHCHSTGRVRGFLCRACNLGIGRFKDNVDLINKAISYLKDRGT